MRAAGKTTTGTEQPNLDFPRPTFRQNPNLKQGLSYESPFADCKYAQIHPLTPRFHPTRMFTQIMSTSAAKEVQQRVSDLFNPSLQQHIKNRLMQMKSGRLNKTDFERPSEIDQNESAYTLECEKHPQQKHSVAQSLMFTTIQPTVSQTVGAKPSIKF